MQRTPEAAGLVMVKLRDDLRVLCLVWVGGKLHRDGLDGSRGFLAVQVFDSLLGLRPLVVPDEGHATGHACTPAGQTDLLPHVLTRVIES